MFEQLSFIQSMMDQEAIDFINDNQDNQSRINDFINSKIEIEMLSKNIQEEIFDFLGFKF